MVDHARGFHPAVFRTFFLLSDPGETFTKEERAVVETVLSSGDLYTALKKTLSNSLWINDKDIVEALRIPLLRSCARYLYKEKRRNYALNSVGETIKLGFNASKYVKFL